MPIELAARTDAGGRLVSTAERLSETLAANAALHDRDVAIGVNMHLIAVANMGRRRQLAVATGQDRRGRAVAASLSQIARDGVASVAIGQPATLH
jgi:hypothetical protein